MHRVDATEMAVFRSLYAGLKRVTVTQTDPLNVFSSSQAEYQPLYISGHSLGGALASLAAYDVNKNFSLPDPITLYT